MKDLMSNCKLNSFKVREDEEQTNQVKSTMNGKFKITKVIQSCKEEVPI